MSQCTGHHGKRGAKHKPALRIRPTEGKETKGSQSQINNKGQQIDIMSLLTMVNIMQQTVEKCPSIDLKCLRRTFPSVLRFQ